MKVSESDQSAREKRSGSEIRSDLFSFTRFSGGDVQGADAAPLAGASPAPNLRFGSILRLVPLAGPALMLVSPSALLAAEEKHAPHMKQLDVWSLLEAGGTIGWIIMALSVWMVALIVQHLVTVRRGALMPAGLAEEVHRLISGGNFKQAQQECEKQPSFEGYVLSAGLGEVGMGYPAVEKAMEDASMQQAARLFRKLEYFTVIGTIAPMLGLLGTVWGMILAFMEFEAKANPQVSELAPGIYRALVTTLQGLCVAIPSLGTYAILRNRVDELVAEATLMCEHVFSNFKRGNVQRRQEARRGRPAAEAVSDPEAAAGGT